MGKASFRFEQLAGVKYFLNIMFGYSKFLRTSLATPRSPNCLLKEFILDSVDLLEVVVSLD